jgi:hypothetical protein
MRSRKSPYLTHPGSGAKGGWVKKKAGKTVKDASGLIPSGTKGKWVEGVGGSKSPFKDTS